MTEVLFARLDQLQVAANINVVDYGAICDGTNDDAPAINAALLAAFVGGRMEVVLPDRTCLCKSTVTIYQNTTLSGIGGNDRRSILKAHSSIAGSYLLQNANQGSYLDSNITIKDLIIDGNNLGNGGSQTLLHGLLGFGYVTNFTMQNCLVKDYHYIMLELPSSINAKILDNEFTNWGYAGDVSVTGEGGPAIYNQSSGTVNPSVRTIIRGNNFHDANWTAIYLGQDFVVTNNIFKTIQEAAIITPYVPAGNALSKNGIFANNIIDGVTKHYISSSCIESEGYNLIFANNQIRNCGHNGILLSDSINNIISDNVISNVNKQGDGAQGAGIVVRSLTGVPKNNVIRGNRIFDDQGTPTSYAGIGYIGTNPATEQLVEGNDLSNTVFVSGSYFLEHTAGRFGANSILRNNLPTSINLPGKVTEGMTGLAVGTNGGIPYFDSTTSLASSAALTQYGLVYGGGTSSAPSSLAAGTNGQIPVAQNSAPPLWKTASGDLTIAASGAFTLASVITAGGPTGSATVAPIITYDAKGRLTTVTSATVTPAVGSITGLGTNVATWLATPSSANLASAITDETGSGALVFGTAPSIANAAFTGTLTVSSQDQTAAWTAYTPTVTCGAGSVTTHITTGRYQQFGKTTRVQITSNITAIGTCTGQLRVSLPTTPAAFTYPLFGYSTSAGYSLQGIIQASTAYAVIQKYDATDESSNGIRSILGTYETN